MIPSEQSVLARLVEFLAVLSFNICDAIQIIDQAAALLANGRDEFLSIAMMPPRTSKIALEQEIERTLSIDAASVKRELGVVAAGIVAHCEELTYLRRGRAIARIASAIDYGDPLLVDVYEIVDECDRPYLDRELIRVELQRRIPAIVRAGEEMTVALIDSLDII